MKMSKNSVLAVTLVLAGSLANAAPAPSVPVKISEVQENVTQQSVRVNGVVQSRHDVQLAATVEGELKWVLEEGSLVEPGQVIAKVDDASLLLRKQEQQVLADRASINLAYLNEEVRRLQTLRQSSMAAETSIAEMISRRDLAENDLQAANARIAQLTEQLGRTEIVSPVAGMVISRVRQAGEFARRGESVIRIVDPRVLEVRISLPLQYLGRVRAGSDVTVDLKQTQLSGSIRAVLFASEQSSQSIEALIDIHPEDSLMMVDGQFAEVSVPLMEQGDNLFVPRDAVVLRGTGSYVFRIDTDNKAVRVDVELLDGRGDMVSVKGQLQAGDKVAIRGVERLSDGQTVIPTTT